MRKMNIVNKNKEMQSIAIEWQCFVCVCVCLEFGIFIIFRAEQNI